MFQTSNWLVHTTYCAGNSSHVTTLHKVTLLTKEGDKYLAEKNVYFCVSIRYRSVNT